MRNSTRAARIDALGICSWKYSRTAAIPSASSSVLTLSPHVMAELSQTEMRNRLGDGIERVNECLGKGRHVRQPSASPSSATKRDSNPSRALFLWVAGNCPFRKECALCLVHDAHESRVQRLVFKITQSSECIIWYCKK